MFRKKNIIILHIQKLVFTKSNSNDIIEINKRLTNTYFDKILQ